MPTSPGFHHLCGRDHYHPSNHYPCSCRGESSVIQLSASVGCLLLKCVFADSLQRNLTFYHRLPNHYWGPWRPWSAPISLRSCCPNSEPSAQRMEESSVAAEAGAKSTARSRRCCSQGGTELMGVAVRCWVWRA